MVKEADKQTVRKQVKKLKKTVKKKAYASSSGKKKKAKKASYSSSSKPKMELGDSAGALEEAESHERNALPADVAEIWDDSSMGNFEKTWAYSFADVTPAYSSGKSAKKAAPAKKPVAKKPPAKKPAEK